MTTHTLSEAIRNVHPSMNSKELNEGLALFKKQSFKAKDHISTADSQSEYLFFTESSITRCYYVDQNGEEQTLWMKPENTFIADFKSFTTGEKSMFSIQFYEDSDVWMIARNDLLQLFEKSNAWALFGIRLMESVHVTLIDVFVNLLANDATRNYQYIEYAFPRFIQVAPLKDIASMLQVSQVTLSRIRSGTQLKN